MTQPQEHLENLREIRSLMERSSRFISLSGLSGVTAGLFALLGAALAFLYTGAVPLAGDSLYFRAPQAPELWGMNRLTFFLLDAGMVLAGALAGVIYFTTRQARRRGLPVWDGLTRRLLINLAIPLLTGGVFILALLYRRLPELVAPATLVFYGLALLNGSKYTFNDVRYLGLSEIALGLTGLFFPGYGLELWAAGFGLLHILYGILMYSKYEHSSKTS